MDRVALLECDPADTLETDRTPPPQAREAELAGIAVAVGDCIDIRLATTQERARLGPSAAPAQNRSPAGLRRSM